MIKCQFREKRKPERDLKLEDFKRKFALDAINEKTIQRLDAELEHLKLVNRHWYNIEIERF